MYITTSMLVQTILVFLAPFLIPRLIRLVQRFLNPRPAGTRTSAYPTSSPIEPLAPRTHYARLALLALSTSYLFVKALSPPSNLFLTLAPAHSMLERLIPFLRAPLHLRIPTEQLVTTFISKLGRNPTTEELTLISRLQSLDGRLLYITFGSSPLLHCTWCNPSSSIDYLLLSLPSLALRYLSVVVITSLLLLPQGRSRYRVYVLGALGIAFVSETYVRWNGTTGNAPIHLEAFFQFLRPLFFVLLILITYILPAPPQPPTTSTLLTPALTTLLQASHQSLLNLRASNVQRMALLHHGQTRDLVMGFWKGNEKEWGWANEDRTVKELVKAVKVEEGEMNGIKVERQEVKRMFGIGRSERSEVQREEPGE